MRHELTFDEAYKIFQDGKCAQNCGSCRFMYIVRNSEFDEEDRIGYDRRCHIAKTYALVLKEAKEVVGSRV